jgi:hypothetical protein
VFKFVLCLHNADCPQCYSMLRERESNWVVNMESGCFLNRSLPASGSGMNTKECICGVSMEEF